MIKLAVVGCCGRMGKRITELASQHKDIKIVALIERPDCPEMPETLCGVKIAKDINAIKGADVLIDFTVAQAMMQNLQACLRHRVRMVIGTTGFTAEQDAAVIEASKQLGIVRSSNMSVGVNVLFGLLRKMTEALKGYTVSITETHHIHKKDAPSGTAKTMGEIVQNAGQMQNVPIESIREGEVIGYHKVTFKSPVDTIEISHNANTRDMFAEGAIVAAKFVAYKDNGLYNMQEVLGLN
ncbi:MAG: 4-hydroxy-tetrahydrodipicolinate reductase [Candidatus Omnitrophica bacterium]|nr:4-hydroxy-tetrahydrodipicolinate reductase [Candidatus Omnitrophota bacterium]